jgi:hypothetical protein
MRTEFWSENIEGGEQLEDLEVDGRIILKFVLEEYGVNVETI